MATVCCSALSYGILQVPYARQEGTVEIQALSRSSGVFAEVDGAQKYLRGQRSARFRLQERKNTVFCKAMQGESPSESNSTIPEYKAGPLDDLFFKIFRQKMAEEVGWNSDIPGYDGLIEVVKYLYTRNTSKEATEASTVRVLTSLFPGWLLPLFRQLIAPISDGKVAAIMTGKSQALTESPNVTRAFVTQATCQWLMGPCTVNEVVLADGSTQLSGTFMKEKMSVPLSMEPNFNDYSCQFKYGVAAPPRDEDPGLLTPCLSICPTAATRSSLRGYVPTEQCPQVRSASFTTLLIGTRQKLQH
ncbi:hypothetical protein AXG93_4170s1220 [Marchantia polymorpha subsp. ruderalis]|uniref:Beta-carotene isomerase D27-like C-terminal domain-containing protein n=1 Tax=Marchantia polymorpha subsp. ruderalis TaxID=1480154 RepID=A0A176VMZ5_MARPO|nr:hypothetical protein AXG93_4170s1220 [Marchantia polymorpha subsp. ruderalis]